MLWLNPETHIDTHTSGSLSAAALQLNWPQRGDGGGGGGGSAVVPPGTTQSAKVMVAAAAMAASLPSPRLMNLGVTLIQLMSVSRSMSRSHNKSYAKSRRRDVSRLVPSR